MPNVTLVGVKLVIRTTSYMKEVVLNHVQIEPTPLPRLALVSFLLTDFYFNIFVDCLDNCAECDAGGCKACDQDYFLYKGDCIESCPDKTYSDSIACHGKL